MFLTGLVYLSLSADLLVKGAGRLASSLGVSTFVVGATIVAYGTSLPEFVVSVIASIKGSGSIALGNVIGSNLINTGLILGIAALLSPLIIDRELIEKLKKVEIPFLVLLTVLVAAMSFGLMIGAWQGIVLLALFAAYLMLSLRTELGQREKRNNGQKASGSKTPAGKLSAYAGATVIGLAGLSIAAWFMVESAITLARMLGVTERFIGLTIVAFGTSLPELAAAVSAAKQKHVEMALGNLIGSNLFNLALILGTAAAIRPIALEPTGKYIDFGFLILNAGMATVFLLSGKRVGRVEGIALIATYAVFVILLVLF